jgi:hypothetical protein
VAAPGGYGHGGGGSGYSYGHGFWGHGPVLYFPQILFHHNVVVAAQPLPVPIATRHRGQQACQLKAGGQVVAIGGYGHSAYGHGPFGGAVPGGYSRGAYGHGTFGHGPSRPGRSVLLIIPMDVTVDRAERTRWDVAVPAASTR